jgi:hypothetical protein
MDSSYSVQEIAGLKRSERRGVALLHGPRLAAADKFASLSPKSMREVLSRIDHWIEGNAAHKKYHHGWSEYDYRNCYVFKWIENRVDQRLYGFLCHPNKSDKRFEACILAIHATKTQFNTDTQILNEIVRLSSDPVVLRAISSGWR